jgi:hypothetical protein
MRSIPRLSIIAAVAVSFLMALPASAAAPAAGTLVKHADQPAVYWFGTDNKRHAFPNVRVFNSWFTDFSGVRTVTAGELSAMPLGPNVDYRPGARLVKLTTDPKVYAVAEGSVLRWVKTEEAARRLFGADWSSRVDDLSDVFFVDYQVGAELDGTSYPDGQVVRASDGVLYLVGAGERRILSGAASSTLSRFAVTADSALLAALSPGTSVTEAATPSGAAATSYPVTPTFSFVASPSRFSSPGPGVTLATLRLSTAAALRVSQVNLRVTALHDEAGANANLDADLGGLVYGNGVRANFARLRLVDEAGNEPFARRELALDSLLDENQAVAFAGDWRVAALSAPLLKLVADVNEGVPDGETYRISILPSGTSVIGGTTGAAVSFLPSAETKGDVKSVMTKELSLAIPSAVTTVVRGSKGVTAFRFSAQAGSADTRLTSLTVQGFLNNEGSGGYLPGGDADSGPETRVNQLVPKVALYAGDSLVSGPTDVSFDGRVTFSGLSYLIKAGETREFSLRGDLVANPPLGNRPDLLAFDLADPSNQVVAVDSDGSAVTPRLEARNIPVNDARQYVQVKDRGRLKFKWQASGGDALAGTPTSAGTLTLTATDDSYTVTHLTFKQTGGELPNSFPNLRLEYTDGGGKAAVKRVAFEGFDANFPSLDLAVPAGRTVTAKIMAEPLPRAAGPVYGEELKVQLVPTATMQFRSAASGEIYNEGDVTAASADDFYAEVGSANPLTLRYSSLSFAKDVASPGGVVDRDNDAEILRFTATAGAGGQVRIRKMKFKVTPGDAGRSGSQNDALEHWASTIGAGFDANAVIDLVRVDSSGNETTVGEDTATALRYYVRHGGTLRSDPTAFDSSSGDYAVFEYDFGLGSEYLIDAGTTANFLLKLDTTGFWKTTALQQNAEFSLRVELPGANELLWTDAPGYSYEARAASSAGLPISTSLSVRKP